VTFLTEPKFSLSIGKYVRLFKWESGEVWVAYKHPDGQWVSLRKATEADKLSLENNEVSQ